ncbi:MAG: chitobiase/beta-hexosaminidase C-terminal domain-containing protein, partial [Armatimonadetes bacterium]|nr:chitobiase/beta-hexosaminidase C-terminal domain-containing protein [Armatimonadota bacterium]
IQAAIDEAAAAGGAVLFLPPGRYRLERPITIREAVTLRGDHDPARLPESTLLLPVADRGNADGPAAITLDRGSGVRNLAVWYPDQRADAPVPYPWTFRWWQGGGDNCTIANVTLVNPWRGVAVGPEGNELHTLREVRGTPLKTGCFFDTCSDIGRLTEVDFSPRWWAQSGLPGAPAEADIAPWLRREATGVDMGRSDWEYVYHVRVSGYHTGMAVHQGAQGTTNAVMFGCELTGGAVGLRLDQLNGIGISATGCRFEGSEAGVLCSDAFTSVAQLNTCTLASSAGPAARLVGTGTLTVQTCTFTGWQGDAVDADNGVISLLGCEFQGQGGAVHLGARLRRARVLACSFKGRPDIRDESRGDVMVSHLPQTFARPDISPHVPAPERRPQGDRLFVVTDHGADAQAGDNTAAFQAALDAAGKAGGGTVYVPAGLYRFQGSLTVPSGVELRGIWDVPHHTQSAGSVLLPLAGRGQEDGPPFLQLEAGSGVRGLLLWWPEQNLAQPVAYPWAVQGLGPGCWVVDVTLGNCWQGVDFWSHPSTGHAISYLAGGMLRRGLAVSKSAGDGWVEDVQFNPHYTVRVHPTLPQPQITEGDLGGTVIRWQRAHLEGLVFGNCANEHQRGNFLYAAYDGIAFRDDGGGANARVLMHGSDTVSRSAFIEAAGPRGIVCVEAQLVPLSDQAVAAFVVDDKFAGKVAFHNSQIWAGKTTGLIAGKGEVLLSQFNSLSGPVHLRGGRCTMVSPHFTGDLGPAIDVGPECGQATIVAALGPGVLRLDNQAGERASVRASSASAPGGLEGPATALKPEQFEAATGFEAGEPRAADDTVQTPGGGSRAVSGIFCRPVESGDAHGGKMALRLAGNADDASYAFVYCRALEGPIGVHEDSRLSYWIRPVNERGQRTFVDLVFTDGSTLRDSPASTRGNQAARAAGMSAKVGAWAPVDVNLGRNHAGKVIAAVMLAYDSRDGGGPFEVLIDDLSLHSDEALRPDQASAEPAGGAVAAGTAVALHAPEGTVLRYTLDGTNPTPDSPRYAGPIELDKPGAIELRFCRENPGGRVSRRVRAALFDVGGR